MEKPEYLYTLWSKAPFAWAIIRAIECEKLSKLQFTSPILEVGCGDGFVTQTLFSGKKGVIDVGIDLDSSELQLAKSTNVYKKLLRADICHNHFASNTFATVFANGVLEHIPDLKEALAEIYRILMPGGVLITTSPIDTYTNLLFYYRLFNWVRLPKLAKKYGNMINTKFVHIHLLPVYKWCRILKQAGLVLTEYEYYNSPSIVALHDLVLPLSLGTKELKKKTGSLVLFPKLRAYCIRPLTSIISRSFLRKSSAPMYGSVLLQAKKIL